MLVLSRKKNERIHIGDEIVITLVRLGNDKVRIGIEAPPHIQVLRGELLTDDSKPAAAEAECE